MPISWCHSYCAAEATAGPSKECSEAQAEQPRKSESEANPGTPWEAIRPKNYCNWNPVYKSALSSMLLYTRSLNVH